MKKKKESKHIHKLKKVNLTRNPLKLPYWVLACQEPACSYYIAITLALGKMAKCWICSDPFLIDKVSIGHTKPHCNDCIKRKVKPNVMKLAELVEDI